MSPADGPLGPTENPLRLPPRETAERPSDSPAPMLWWLAAGGAGCVVTFLVAAITIALVVHRWRAAAQAESDRIAAEADAARERLAAERAAAEEARQVRALRLALVTDEQLTKQTREIVERLIVNRPTRTMVEIAWRRTDVYGNAMSTPRPPWQFDDLEVRRPPDQLGPEEVGFQVFGKLSPANPIGAGTAIFWAYLTVRPADDEQLLFQVHVLWVRREVVLDPTDERVQRLLPALLAARPKTAWAAKKK